DQLLPGMHIRPLSRLDREPCIWLYESPIVFEDGKLGLCGCRDFNANSELIVGNIMESSLHEIWQSEKVRQIRYGFSHGDYPEICSKCSQYVNLDVIRTSVGTRLAALTDKRFKETLPDSSCPDAIVKNNQEL
ncbi:MAG: SPASM domain-containing protein, partial [Nitrosomonas sp.]|nr:SPASM domain-containing protein [Nitrosomonas sp.]